MLVQYVRVEVVAFGYDSDDTTYHGLQNRLVDLLLFVFISWRASIPEALVDVCPLFPAQDSVGRFLDQSRVVRFRRMPEELDDKTLK